LSKSPHPDPKAYEEEHNANLPVRHCDDCTIVLYLSMSVRAISRDHHSRTEQRSLRQASIR